MKRRLGLHANHCCAAIVAAIGFAGCSVHPLPQDAVPLASTVEIVRRIRCEAMEGLKEARNAVAHDPESRAHLEKIIEGTTIGFDFKFVIAESNKAAGGELVFHRKDLEDVGFKLTVVGQMNPGHDDGKTGSSRRNTRVFRVLDELDDLKDARCRRVKTNSPNLAYPITGSTGMAEVVRTYLELELLTDIRGAVKMIKVKEKGKDGKVQEKEKPVEIVTFSDELDFTTRFEMGAIPNLEFQTAVGTLKLTKASVAGSVLRKDVHSVTVVLARDEKHVHVDLQKKRTTAGGFLIKDVRDKRLQALLTQRTAVARNRILFELNRRRFVDEDREVTASVLGQPLP